MKYLRTYENMNKYNIGDYVIIRRMSEHELIMRGFPADETDTDYTNQELMVELVENPSIWKDGTKKTIQMKLMDYLDKRSKPFTGKFSDNPNIIRLYVDDIIKKMTPEEVERYKLKKTTDKYNL